MEVILISIFSAIIIFITVYFMIKVFIIAYKRNEITLRKLRVSVTTSIVIGLIIASSLPFGYQKLFDTFLQPHL
jgi:heme/copper-type cytochrome/quinol oxidase subunit 2